MRGAGAPPEVKTPMPPQGVAVAGTRCWRGSIAGCLRWPGAADTAGQPEREREPPTLPKGGLARRRLAVLRAKLSLRALLPLSLSPVSASQHPAQLAYSLADEGEPHQQTATHFHALRMPTATEHRLDGTQLPRWEVTSNARLRMAQSECFRSENPMPRFTRARMITQSPLSRVAKET